MAPHNSSRFCPICWVKRHNTFGRESQIQRRDSFLSPSSSAFIFSRLANATERLCSASLGLSPTETFILHRNRARCLPARPPARATPQTPGLSRAPPQNYFPAWPSLHPEQHSVSKWTASPAGFFIISSSRKPKAPIIVFTLLVFAMKLYRGRKGDLCKKQTYNVFIRVYETSWWLANWNHMKHHLADILSYLVLNIISAFSIFQHLVNP